MNLPRKSEVGHVEAVPGGVLEEPVAAGAVVDEYHECDADAAKCVERPEPLLPAGAALRALRLIALFALFDGHVEAHRPLEAPPLPQQPVERAMALQPQNETRDHAEAGDDEEAATSQINSGSGRALDWVRQTSRAARGSRSLVRAPSPTRTRNPSAAGRRRQTRPGGLRSCKSRR